MIGQFGVGRITSLTEVQKLIYYLTSAAATRDSPFLEFRASRFFSSWTPSTSFQTPDIQKVLAFEGAFEKLFNIVREGGIEGGAVAHEALICVDNLRGLTRATKNWTATFSSLPAAFPAEYPARCSRTTGICSEFWDDQKLVNALAIVAIIGLLIRIKRLRWSRLLCIHALPDWKSRSHLMAYIPQNTSSPSSSCKPQFPLSELIITPYMPVPETNGEEWDRFRSCFSFRCSCRIGFERRVQRPGKCKETDDQAWNYELQHILARSIKPQPPTQIPSSAAGGGSFFVPADGPAPEPTPAAHKEDDDPPQTLLQILAEHLSLVFLSRSIHQTWNQENGID
ncbi:hypothetical protein BT96DRAFT_1026834 [Gymnopus androsaceus JB14]|uniref:Uncharacterized protein n=1 Tax=Gymnopus androsaceus JB14 TaxID=1447944 RepID=A0A6A4GH84_9AGAR|nr:hypothetical protein BT96DRAFT_1026834 [Gymnopus androsaceus JB14]